MPRPLPHRFQYQKKSRGFLKKVQRKKMFSPKSVTKLEDMTVWTSNISDIETNFDYLIILKDRNDGNLLNQKLKKIEAQRTLLILRIRKIEGKRTLLIQHIRKIKAKGTLHIKEIKIINAK